ncbi:MAG: response regulator transcription factor [Acidimicrobiales bacterium]
MSDEGGVGAEARAPRGRVLVVDDEPDILLLVRVILEAAGYEALLAADGEQALQRIAEDSPDLVLLDVMMPVMDGWGVLRALRQRPSAPPVVVVSVRSGQRDVELATELGAAAYVTKPFDSHELVALVGRVLSERGR